MYLEETDFKRGLDDDQRLTFITRCDAGTQLSMPVFYISCTF